MSLRLEIEFDCVNFVKKTKRTTAGHRLSLEAPQQTEPAMYIKLMLYARNKCVFSRIFGSNYGLRIFVSVLRILQKLYGEFAHTEDDNYFKIL